MADDEAGLPAEISGQLDVYHHALHLAEQNAILDAAVWFHTGLSHRVAGRGDSAVICFKKVIEVDPDEPLAYWELVDLYIQQEAPEAAVIVLSALGERLAGRLVWTQAVAAWKRAAELAPDDADILRALQEAYAHAGQIQEAAAIQSILQALRPGMPAPAQPAPDAASAAPTAAPTLPASPPTPADGSAGARPATDGPAPAKPAAGGKAEGGTRKGSHPRGVGSSSSAGSQSPARGPGHRLADSGKGRRSREPLLG
ncbi:MAG TPA: tetratricopeptide repeat protein, partial [bacterium]|nr:tetratricopeptide repeat protein [bacterium]